jgi:hypothetical protein
MLAGAPWAPIYIARSSPLHMLLGLQKRNGGRVSPTKPRPKSAGAAAATKRKRPAASGGAPLPPVLAVLAGLLHIAAHCSLLCCDVFLPTRRPASPQQLTPFCHCNPRRERGRGGQRG